MTNEDFYFDNELKYKAIGTDSPQIAEGDTIIVPFPLLILCTQGTAKIVYNLEPYTITKDTAFCMFPNTTLKAISVSDDIKCKTLAFDKEAVIDATTGFNIEYFGSVFANPLKQMKNEQDKLILNNLLEVLSTYSHLDKRFERNNDFVHGIIRNIIIALAEMYKIDNDKRHIGYSTFTTTDNYFREFMQLLSQYSKTQHNVAFYADKLCITPKYLNEICRKKTQKTAKEVITRSVIAQIKNALIISGTSVQRIAYDFNFCDQSSFGKYFKKAVGLAPMAFRNKHNTSGEVVTEE